MESITHSVLSSVESHDLKSQCNKQNRLIAVNRFITVHVVNHRGTIVALKSWKEYKAATVKEMNEMRMLSCPGRLEPHSNLVNVLYRLPSPLPCLVLDMCLGGSLRDRILQTHYRPIEVDILHWARQIISGLLHLHHSGVVHGDLNTHNILFKWSDSHELKVSDFGFARHLNPVHGSVRFRPPEQLTLDGCIEHVLLSPKMDIWSLGVILLSCATGAQPHNHVHSERALRQGIIDGTLKVDSGSGMAGRHSPFVQLLVALCCARDCNERPSIRQLNRIFM